MSKSREFSTYKRMAEVLDYPYVTAEQISILLPVSCNESHHIRQKIEEEMKEKGEFLFHTRPKVVPVEKVLEYGKLYGIPSADYIRKMAKS